MTKTLNNRAPPAIRMHQKKLHAKIVNTLRKSQEQAGELQSVLVCKQHKEIVLSGAHRSEARSGLKNIEKIEEYDIGAYAKKLGIPHEIGEELIRAQANVHRRVGKEETKTQILRVAKGLERTIPKERVASELADKMLPFSRSYILRLLPDEYKQKNYARSHGRRHASSKKPDDPGHQSQPRSETRAAPKGASTLRTGEDRKENLNEGACSRCQKGVEQESITHYELCPGCVKELLLFDPCLDEIRSRSVPIMEVGAQ